MNFRLFGFRFGRPEKADTNTKSFALPINEDGALVVEVGPNAAYNKYICDIEGVINNEIDLIYKYRNMAMDGTVQKAIDEVVNDMIVSDEEKPPVSLVIGDNFKFSDRLREKIELEFTNVLKLLNFNNQAYNIARRWYIDAKLHYHIIIDADKPEAGIQELRYVDPRYIKKIREVEKGFDTNTRQEVVQKVTEYYLYDKMGFSTTGPTTAESLSRGEKITIDSIAAVDSGLPSTENTMILSYLHSAIRPYNQLRAMEDALIIYRITRAPERRVFNIDVGDMPPAKAKQYVQQIMDDFRNKLVYNPTTGETRDDRRHMMMLEDFYFPKRGEQQSSVETLAGGQNLSEIEDVTYFQQKLYESLFIPRTRLDPENGFSLGRAAEISREEVKFSKFITRLRHQFSKLFDELLKRQLILKKITTEDDWDAIRENIFYDFLSDSYFAELKKTEILKERLDILDQMTPYAEEDAKYFSSKYIKKEILLFDDDEIAKMQKEIDGDVEPPPEEKAKEEPAAPSGEPEEPVKPGKDISEPEPSEIEVPKPEEEQ